MLWFKVAMSYEAMWVINWLIFGTLIACLFWVKAHAGDDE